MSSWVRLGGLGLVLFGAGWLFFIPLYKGYGFLYLFFGLYMLTSGVMYKASPDVWRERYGGYPGWLGFIFQMKFEIFLYTVLSVVIWLFAAPMVFRITGWILLTYTTLCVYHFCFREA